MYRQKRKKTVWEKNSFQPKYQKFRQTKLSKLLDVKFGEAKLLIGAANVICGEATRSPLIKTAFGCFNQLVLYNKCNVTAIRS